MTILFDDVNVFYNHSDPVSSFIAPRFSRPPKKITFNRHLKCKI